MFEAFKVGITIALTNTVSSALGMMSKDFIKTDAEAQRLKSTLKEIKMLGATGILFGAAGMMGLKLVEAAVKPATEYAHQLNIMNMAGLKQAEIADAVGAAWKNTRDVMTTTATENLKSLLDLRNVLGNMEDAKAMLPIVTKIEAVMAASGSSNLVSNAHDIAFSMAKALDVIGAVSNPAVMQRQAAEMSKVIAAFQGRVTPQMFQQVFTYARQAKFDMSDEFKYEILPSLMLEMATKTGGGGGSRGVGPMLAAMYRITNQGYINKKALPELESLGLVDGRSALRTTTSGTTVSAMKEAALAASNPFRWVNEVLVPAIRKKYGEGVTDEFVRSKINEVMRGNQLAASMAVEFFTKQNNFLRDQKIIQGAMPFNEAFKQATNNDYFTARTMLDKQWESFKIALGKDIVPIIVPALLAMARGINALTSVITAHPTATRLIMEFVAVFSALLIAVGTGAGIYALVLAFGLLGGIFAVGTGTIGLIVAGIAAAVTAVYEIYAHWGTMSARIKAVIVDIWNNSTLGILWNLATWIFNFVGRLIGMWRGKSGDTVPAAQTVTNGAAGAAGIDVSGAPGQGMRIGAPPKSMQPIAVNNQLFLDGRQIHESTMQFMYNDMNVVPPTGSSFDGRQSLQGATQ